MGGFIAARMALATNCNPGSSPTLSPLLVLALTGSPEAGLASVTGRSASTASTTSHSHDADDRMTPATGFVRERDPQMLRVRLTDDVDR